MRWEKGEDFVEIASATSTDIDGAVWHIESSLELKGLPIELRKQVPKADDEGYKSLKQAVSSWAERNGYQLVSSSAP